MESYPFICCNIHSTVKWTACFLVMVKILTDASAKVTCHIKSVSRAKYNFPGSRSFLHFTNELKTAFTFVFISKRIYLAIPMSNSKQAVKILHMLSVTHRATWCWILSVRAQTVKKIVTTYQRTTYWQPSQSQIQWAFQLQPN